MLQDCLKTIWETVTGHDLIAQPLPFWLPFVPVGAKRAYWNMVYIRTGYHKLALRILGLQAGAVLLR